MATSKQTTTVKTVQAPAPAAAVAVAVVPSFAESANAIVKSYKTAGKAEKVLFDSLESIFRLFLDKCRVAGVPRDEAGCDAVGKAMMVTLKPDGIIGKALTQGIHPRFQKETLKNYIGGAKRAHHHNVQWKASIFTDKTMACPWSKKAAAAAAKTAAKADAKAPAKAAGKVQTTSLKELQATLMKAIEQARLLNMRDLANALGSVAAERLDGFKFESKSE